MNTNLNILLVDNTSNTIDKLEAVLSNYGKVTRVIYNKLSDTVTGDHQLIVLSGSHQIDLNNTDLANEVQIIKNSNIPVLGICFGFELICKIFDSKIIELKELQNDFRLVTVDKTFFKLAPETIAVKEYHKMGVIEVVDPLQVLGNSSSGIEIVKHKTKPIIGFQFHPELFTELTQGDDLLTIAIEYLTR